MYVGMYVCMYVHVCMYVCMYVFMYVCMYVNLCIYVYIYIHKYLYVIHTCTSLHNSRLQEVARLQVGCRMIYSFFGLGPYTQYSGIMQGMRGLSWGVAFIWVLWRSRHKSQNPQPSVANAIALRALEGPGRMSGCLPMILGSWWLGVYE